MTLRERLKLIGSKVSIYLDNGDTVYPLICGEANELLRTLNDNILDCYASCGLGGLVVTAYDLCLI